MGATDIEVLLEDSQDSQSSGNEGSLSSSSSSDEEDLEAKKLNPSNNLKSEP